MVESSKQVLHFWQPKVIGLKNQIKELHRAISNRAISKRDERIKHLEESLNTERVLVKSLKMVELSERVQSALEHLRDLADNEEYQRGSTWNRSLDFFRSTPASSHDAINIIEAKLRSRNELSS
jgi:hypothetical protein